MLTIEKVSNGYIVTLESGEKEIHSDIASALRTILSEIGPEESRYSEKRVYIITAPGDKHESFTEKHSDVIWNVE